MYTHTHDTMTTLSGAGAAFVCVYFCFAQPTRRAASNFYLFISIPLSLSIISFLLLVYLLLPYVSFIRNNAKIMRNI